MKRSTLVAVLVVVAVMAGPAFSQEKGQSPAPSSALVESLRPEKGVKEHLTFASFAENEEQLANTLYLTESVRTFGGVLKEAPIRIYAPRGVVEAQPALVGKIIALRAKVRTSTAPDDALGFPFARKVFAAAQAETDEEGRTEILAWMDEDTIVLDEPRDFPVLYRDPVFVEWCKQDQFKAIFLHQAALAGAILSDLKRQEMLEFTSRYNFPLFFKEMYGARREFDSIAEVVTLRYDVYFQNPAPDWALELKGPPEKVAWLKERLGKK